MNREDARSLKPGEMISALIEGDWRLVTVIEPVRQRGAGAERAVVAAHGTQWMVEPHQMRFS